MRQSLERTRASPRSTGWHKCAVHLRNTSGTGAAAYDAPPGGTVSGPIRRLARYRAPTPSRCETLRTRVWPRNTLESVDPTHRRRRAGSSRQLSTDGRAVPYSLSSVVPKLVRCAAGLRSQRIGKPVSVPVSVPSSIYCPAVSVPVSPGRKPAVTKLARSFSSDCTPTWRDSSFPSASNRMRVGTC